MNCIEVIKLLLEHLPGSGQGDETWDYAWNELSDGAQNSVISAYTTANKFLSMYQPKQLSDIAQILIDGGWEFSISYGDNIFSICICRPDWVTNDIYTARICPEGKGETLEEAYAHLAKEFLNERTRNTTEAKDS